MSIDDIYASPSYMTVQTKLSLQFWPLMEIDLAGKNKIVE